MNWFNFCRVIKALPRYKKSLPRFNVIARSQQRPAYFIFQFDQVLILFLCLFLLSSHTVTWPIQPHTHWAYMQRASLKLHHQTSSHTSGQSYKRSKSLIYHSRVILTVNVLYSRVIIYYLSTIYKIPAVPFFTTPRYTSDLLSIVTAGT